MRSLLMQRKTIRADSLATRKLWSHSSSKEKLAPGTGLVRQYSCKQRTSDLTVSKPRIETASAGLVTSWLKPHAGELTICSNRAVRAGSRAMTSAMLSTVELGDSALLM